ncbi:hypothetical protein EP47_00040 [Legionella norrlandica]|uniref:Uncharacterized protein n=1 Tax=Legionella norrlandica TaxID=1498499 RepID=A0A0A2TA23_9GAMM|nr:hypothetical protein [Legionella norrlandica]KGP64278.1 hypothetical protein EP47_00040 [Legionella norrlandica]
MLTKFLKVVIVNAGIVGTGVIKERFENPELLVTLPFSIMTHAISPSPEVEFACPYRKQLHEMCSDATFFDRMTIIPVNKYLERQKVPLSKEAFIAIKNDIEHSKQMEEPRDPHQQIRDFWQQSRNQREIAQAFHNSGEREGAALHNSLASGFSLKATLAEHALAHNMNAVDENVHGFNI